MLKIFVLVLVATIAVAIASRNVRSPGGRGWQQRNSYGEGQPVFDAARSSVVTWFDYGNGLGRSLAGDGENDGWRAAKFGSLYQRQSPKSAHARKSYPVRVATPDDSFELLYSGASAANVGKPNRNNGIRSFSSGWDNSKRDFDGNNDWQSSSW